MGLGVSILLIAAGAILAFAVNTTVTGVDINTIGWILLIAGIGVEAGRSEERGPHVARPERVAAAAVHSSEPLGLVERVDGKPARAVEPALVAGAREGLEESEPVSRGAVADAVALLVAVGSGLPDELRAGEQQLLVEVLQGAGDDARSPRAPLQASGLATWCSRPVRKAVLADCMPRENCRRLTGKRLVRLEPEQGEGIARGTVNHAEAAIVVVLPPEPVVSAALAQRYGRFARGIRPARLAGPFVHRQSGEQRPGCAPHHVVSRVRDVGAHERVQVVRKGGLGGEPEGDQQRPGLSLEQRRLVVMLIRRGVRRRTHELERAQRGCGEVERRLRMAAPAQRVERPDHTGGADVEVLHRERSSPSVPFVGEPETFGIEGRIGVADDPRDRLLDPGWIPGLVGQRLELAWFVEHRREPMPQPTPVWVRWPAKRGGPCRDRTYDLGIKSPLLYQLS